MPAAEHERDRDRDQHEQHDVEPVPRETALLPPAHARVALGAVVAVPQLDRTGIEWGLDGLLSDYGMRVLGQRVGGHGPGHAEIVRGFCPRATPEGS